MSDNVNTILQAFLPDYSIKMYVREIAIVTSINRQTVSETLKVMENERLLDSKISGRQKIYFLNSKNQLTKLKVINAENTMRMAILNKRIISTLIKYLDMTSTVIIFGSYAKGTERKDSDIDLLIISDEKYDFERFEKETGKNIQAIYMKSDEFINGFFQKDPLISEIVKDHICLKNTETFVDILWEVNYGKIY
ncbi:MAG: nucleotidyltransferase domain-containing protein [DPANN group archaeon]|nr:nucleotidyltransferase domain-containing protein [DPANN group archaeon]